MNSLTTQLDSIAPRFLLKKGDIEVINEPSIFYQTLLNKISTAKSRVYLSTLYIGTKQHELVQCIDKAMEKNEDLKVYLLTDALRGTREAPNPCSASLLAPLEEKYGRRIDIRMYHTPHLAGFSKMLTPKRINEGWGLQHMKLYGFDQEIILSGANLSEDYFTNRQDRYYLFKNKPLSDYYFKIHDAVSLLSYRIVHTNKLKQGFKLTWPTSNASCEPHLNFHRFVSDSSYLLTPILQQQALSSFEEFEHNPDYDTIVYPVSQFTPLFPANQDQSTEKPAILRVLSYGDSPKVKWWFTAGYFNMLPEYQNRLLNGKSKGTIITASPKANSFYKSPGVSYYLPQAYLLFAKQFLEQVKHLGKSALITVYEWQKGIVNTPNGWSYHAKGLWVTAPNENEPSITVIGSSNYTKRAYSCDLESNAIIITKDQELKNKMKNEIDHLMKDVNELTLSDFAPKKLESTESEPKYSVDEDRKISYGVHLAVKLLGGRL
ncbi:PGS1 CDP-diacylglycerol--glycerol-3-phosphate 3-phosphatidyltransferase [Candida maltosa Xu316]